MQLHQGDMWTELGQADLILVTTNAAVNRAGELVMGRGAALEAKERFPGLAFELGQRLMTKKAVRQQYGVLLARQVQYGTVCQVVGPPDRRDLWICRREELPAGHRPTMLGAFQVKYVWNEPASLDLIRHSTAELIRLDDLLRRDGTTPRIVLNFPGIGNGRLAREQVLPILEDLPNNVHIYELEK